MRVIPLISVFLLFVSTANGQDRHLSQGIVYFKQQQYDRALEEFEQAHTANPHSDVIDNLLGVTETKLGDPDRANHYYEAAIAANPSNVSPYKNLGFNYLTEKRFNLAEAELTKAAELAPQDPFVHYYLATLYLETSRDADAVRQLEPARALIEGDSALLFQMASACVRLNHKDEAASLIDELEAHSELDVSQEYSLGVLLTAQKMYPQAVERFRRITQMQPTSEASRFDLAIALIHANELPEATAILQSLAAEHAQDAQLFTLLGSVYEATGNYPKALSAYATAVRLAPDNPDRYLAYTRLLMNIDRYGEAAEIVQRGMKDTPDDYALQLRLGSIELSQGQYPEARQSFEKAIQEHPEIPLGYFALAQGYMRDGSNQKAAEVLASARRKLPPDAMIEYLYGLVLSHLSENREAMDAFQRSVALNPNVAESHYELGKLYLQSGQIQQARAEFERVLALAPEHANAYYQLSRIYARLGDMHKSREMAERTQVLLLKQREAALQAEKMRLGNFQPAQP